MRIRNLGLSRPVALTIVIVTLTVCMTVIIVSAIGLGMPDGAVTPIFTLSASIMAAIVGGITALKAIETADTAAKTKNVVEFTASKRASFEQSVMQHAGVLCPRDDCPLKLTDDGQ